MPITPGLRKLRAVIAASLPQVRVEDMLRQVDRWTGLTRALTPLGGYEPRGGEDTYRTLLAALIAHGRPATCWTGCWRTTRWSGRWAHTTDTHGFTEQLFGLCHLLGIAFMPRLKDLPDQQLYKLDTGTDHGPFEPLFRGTVDTALIAEQWDQLVRIAASLRDRTAPAHLVLQRLQRFPGGPGLEGADRARPRVQDALHLALHS